MALILRRVEIGRHAGKIDALAQIVVAPLFQALQENRHAFLRGRPLPLSPDTPAANGYGPNMSGNPEPFVSGSGFLHLPQRFHNRASLVPNLSYHNEAVGESGAKG